MSGKADICAPVGSSFEVAFDSFKMLFKIKTGKHWNERFTPMRMGDGFFTYTAPKEGEPRGCEEGWENAIMVV